MFRLVMLGVLIWVIYHLLKREGILPSSKASSDTDHDTVQCAYCGVYSPKKGSYLIGNRYFCCKEHSNLTQ